MPRTNKNHKRMLFLGGGNIANAVACGLVKSGNVPAEYISVYDINPEQLKKFDQYGISTSTDLKSVINDAEFIFLAVKPSIVSVIAKQLSEYEGIADRCTVISFAAAVSIKHITDSFGKEIPVIRTMPSTPILVGEGVIAACRNDLVTEKNFEYFCRTLSSIAHVSVVEEELMNPIISVHGSSPAYVYLFVKAMLDSAEQQGIDNSVALPLILKTIKGSITMIEKSDVSIDTLINNVASPNGTTLAALNSFEKDDFCGSVSRAMKACSERADEISNEL